MVRVGLCSTETLPCCITFLGPRFPDIVTQCHGGGGEDVLILGQSKEGSFGKSGKWAEKIKLEPVNSLPKFFIWDSLAYNPKKAQ